MNKVKVLYKQILIVIICASTVLSQESSFLAQKLMVENDLRKRITNALSKLIDDRKYVIDVNADIEITGGSEEQITILDEGQRSPQQLLQEISHVTDRDLESVSSDKSIGISSGLPIPGFEFESDTSVSESATPSSLSSGIDAGASSAGRGKDNILSRTVTSKYPSTAKIKKLDISIILQEGAAPEMIENIRQVVMVAARFNRTRGDALSIMTATFKERRDQKTAEQILLKSIADKLETIENQQSGEGFVNWKEELDDYKSQEAERREQDKMYFQQQLTTLETTARERAYQKEKRDILRRDSLKLQVLNDEIENLKSMMSSSDISGDEVEQTQSTIGEKVSEKKKLDQQITEKLAMLDAVQSDLDSNMNGDSSTMMIVFISILGVLVLVLIIALIIVIMGKKQNQQPLPPPWMYPPRKRKKKEGTNKENGQNASQSQPLSQTPPPPPPPPPVEDQRVLQSEISDMRQSVASMSVGQPETATRIVKEWMEEEAPQEPEPQVQPESDEEGDKGKKTKKKKK